MKYIGKYGEYRVLACLLEQDIEVYPAIKTNQPDFDLTAILASGKVIRIQVKSTELNNRSTNNSIKHVDKEYDFLVVVVIGESNTPRFFIMSKAEALTARGENKQLGITHKIGGVFEIKNTITQYENKWDTIKNNQG